MADSTQRQQSASYGLTLQQWIEKSGSCIQTAAPGIQKDHVYKYTKSAIPVALKLTECLILAERDQENGRVNPIPLASIVAPNVIVRIQEADPLMVMGNSDEEHLDSLFTDTQFPEETQEQIWGELAEEDFTALSLEEEEVGTEGGGNEIIESVEIIFIHIDNQDAGRAKSRLFALGVILYELFSRQRPQLEPPQLTEIGACNNNTLNDFNHSLKASNDAPIEDHSFRHSKSRRASRGSDGGIHSKNFPSLQFFGIPQSLCALIRNLLNCNQEIQTEDSYNNFSDVHMDLKLMMDDPSVFLDNINIGSKPSLSTSDKLYGREEEVEQLKIFYEKSMNKECAGVLIMGDPGVGKSTLAMYAKELTTKEKGYFLSCKFDQNQDIKPLSIIGSVFDQFCETVARVMSQHQRRRVSKELTHILGDELTVLIQILPNLSKIVSLDSGSQCLDSCVDSTRRIKYLFCILITTLSSLFSRPVTFFLDDLQWADPSSLLLIRSLLIDTKESSCLFFICCFRSKKNSSEEAVYTWYRSIPRFVMEEVQLKNLDVAKSNRLISAALQLSPRLTLPLASVLHRKTRGNPFFLKHLLESLIKDGLLHFSLEQGRWHWNVDKISNLKIADTLIALLTEEIQSLPHDLRLALNVVACMGNMIDKALLMIISGDTQINLEDALNRVVRKGFLDDLGTKYRFVHDRIQKVAYESIPPRQRAIRHMQFGLHICAHALDNNPEDDEMFFIAVNQINHGGPNALNNPVEKVMIASLNLKAGKRAIVLSDFASALKFFKHGISFFIENHWNSHYDLSLEIFDATIDAACNVGDMNTVQFYAESVLSNATSFEDKCNTLFVIIKTLRQANLLYEAQESAFDLLVRLGEDLPAPAEESQLQIDIIKTKMILAKKEDDVILGLTETREKKTILLMKLYHELTNILQSVDPSRMMAISLRMVHLTLPEGICFASPLAFAYFGITLILLGDPEQAYRLGTLALKLLEKLNSTECKSSTIAIVHGFISWTKEPVHLTSQAHLHGYKVGKLSGDIMYASMNYQLFLVASYVHGQSLPLMKTNSHKFIQDLTQQNQMYVRGYSILLYTHVMTLIEGPEYNVTQDPTIGSSLGSISELDRKNADFSAAECVFNMARLFLFRNYNDMEREVLNFNSTPYQKGAIRMLMLVGVFYEGLISFCLARRTAEQKWLELGNTALSKIKHWSECACWNFESKFLLLQSEKLHTVGDFDSASICYQKAITSAHEHKFTQEEGIACELAGTFYLEQNNRRKSMEYFSRSLDCYQSWGSDPLVRRIESMMLHESGNESFVETSWEKYLLMVPSLTSVTVDNNKRRR